MLAYNSLKRAVRLQLVQPDDLHDPRLQRRLQPLRQREQ